MDNVGVVIMDIDADEEMKAQLAAAGQAFPMTMNMNQSMASSLKTEASTENNSLPVVLSYDDISIEQSMNGQPMPTAPENPMLNAKIYAQINENGAFKVDKVEGNNINSQMKQTVSKTLDKMFDMVKFPEQKLKIGESFEVDVPFSLPVMGKPIDMDIKTVYTLKDVKNGIAIFSLTQEVEMTADLDGMSISATGNGTGALRFNTKSSFYEDYQTKLKMNMNMVVPNPGKTMRMNMNMDMDSNVQYQIVK